LVKIAIRRKFMDLEEIINNVTEEDMNDSKIHLECLKVISKIYPHEFQSDHELLVRLSKSELNNTGIFVIYRNNKEDNSTYNFSGIVFDRVRMIFAIYPLDGSILDQLDNISKKYFNKQLIFDSSKLYLVRLIELLKFNEHITDSALELWLKLQ